jgi:hypothetical protein
MNLLSTTNYTWSGLVFIFILVGSIGKFGIFPSNLGILGILDGISLFASVVLLALNKYVYLVVLA